MSAKTFAKALALVALCSSLLMMVQMTVLQQLDHGVPGARGLVGIDLCFAVIAVRGWWRAVPSARQRTDRVLHGMIILYFLTLVVIGISFDPQTHRSASVHQTYGACHVKATDITGHTRYKFLCAEDFDEDFTFSCVGTLPPAGSDWYTVCGRPHRDFRHFLLALVALATLGIGLYSALLGAFRRRMAAI